MIKSQRTRLHSDAHHKLQQNLNKRVRHILISELGPDNSSASGAGNVVDLANFLQNCALELFRQATLAYAFQSSERKIINFRTGHSNLSIITI